MLSPASELFIFSSKVFILLIFILLLLAGILALFSRGKEKSGGQISIKNLNKKFDETSDHLFETLLSKKELKNLHKLRKTKKSTKEDRPNIFVIHFQGDIKASAVESLREEITAILSVSQPKDEVVACIESPGGMVHSYGLAAAQLQRIRDKHIPLTVIVDKVAASGGYLMASVANTILAAPFAIIGSIGVVIQMPNFHRLLKEKNIDFEQLTAGNFKRTLSLFGVNTQEGREKLQEEIEEIHQHFKQIIKDHRPQLDIEKVATGEHWLGQQALELKLIDGLTTSDAYLFEKSQKAKVYEIRYRQKKSFFSRLTAGAMNLSRFFMG